MQAEAVLRWRFRLEADGHFDDAHDIPEGVVAEADATHAEIGACNVWGGKVQVRATCRRFSSVLLCLTSRATKKINNGRIDW